MLDSGSVEAHDRWQNSLEPLIAENQEFEIRWDEDMPTLPADLEESSRSRISSNTWNESVAIADHAGHIYEAVEAAQPIHANLIEFPRELIATRRMRPRLTDAYSGSAVDEYGQLSIFEVDPSSISIEPAMSDSGSASAAPSWSGPEWSAIHLDAQPVYEPEYRYAPETRNASLKQAPIGRRLIATVVDVALIAITICGIAALVASQFQHLPSQKATEICTMIIAIVIGVLYQVFFLTVAKTTPGMRWAQISFCTFDDEIPSREQMRERLKAMAVSLFRITSPMQYLGAAAFVAWIYGIDVSVAHLAVAAALAVVLSLGAVGLPGQVSFMAATMPVTSAMGLPLEPLGLLLAVDTIPDVFATVGNVSADLTASSVVARGAAEGPAT